MMIKRLFCLLLILFAQHSLCMAQHPAGKGYVLLFEENFTGDSVDLKHWRYRIDRRTGYGYMDGLNRKENVYVKDSALHVVLNHEKINDKWENTGGGIISNHHFGYGYYECLSKPFMDGHGVHSAFWQRGSKNPYNNIFEIDGYEIDSKTYLSTNNLYFDLPIQGTTRRPWPHRAQVPFTLLKDGWFLDAYEITPDGVIFYDNGKIVAKAEWDQLNAQQNVWLTALNGVGHVDSTKQPAETIFKYFKYYAKDYPGITILPNGNFEYNQDVYDRSKPLCWIPEGDLSAIQVVKGDAYLENYKLRIGEQKTYQASLKQKLDLIMNGSYTLMAMVRTNGKTSSKLKLSNYGGKEVYFPVPASASWTKIEIPNIKVTANTIEIAILAYGEAGSWIDLDDILFLKPGPKNTIIRAKPFSRPEEPFWTVGQTKPIKFTGDERFYFFDRNVGYGDTISVSMKLTADQRANMTPIARMPKKGNSGWSINLTKEGGLIFRIGSMEDHTDVLVSDIYTAGEKVVIACAFEKGTVYIFKNGILKHKQGGIQQNTKDATAAGRLGTVGKDYEAVGDVVMKVASVDKETKQYMNFRGTIEKLEIHNRKVLNY